MILLIQILAVTATYTENPPVIDGKLESVWFTAEELTGFTQQEPDEGKPATENTFAYVLTDNQNLYVAFRCLTKGRKPIVHIRGWDRAQGDEVTLYLDTFGDRRTAYFFTVSAAGTQEDGITTRGGVAFDDSWDGVWFAATSVSDTGYIVEIKIPFKAIRYQKGVWGIQLRRVIPVNGEEDYLSPVKRFPGFRISTFVPLEGINPEVKGRFLEIYPVGLIRKSTDYSLDGGIDISYNPTAAFGFNLTVNPDFAQIEADPYTVNLSRYAVYLAERRPFFLEGKELFTLKRSNNFNIGPGPVDILYTRTIGKIIDDTTEVPIRLGLKSVMKIKGLESAVMYVNTGSAGAEPEANYYAFRLSGNVKGITPGLTGVGKITSSGMTNLLSLDASFVSGTKDIITQMVVADSCDTIGYSAYVNYVDMSPALINGFYLRYITDGFRIGEVGYVGQKGLSTGGLVGKLFFPRASFLRMWGFGLGYGGTKEVYLEHLSQGLFTFLFFNTRNNWNFSTHWSFGSAWEDTSGFEFHYTSKELGMNFNSDWSKPLAINLWSSFSYSFNWSAWHMGYSGNLGFYTVYRPLPSLSVSTTLRAIGWWKEGVDGFELFDKENIEDYYITASPELNVHFTTKLSLGLRGEAVWENAYGKIIQFRINPVLTYNFSPKSWLYLVYSHTEQLAGDTYLVLDRGMVLKVRWLIYL